MILYFYGNLKLLLINKIIFLPIRIGKLKQTEFCKYRNKKVLKNMSSF